MKHVQCMGGIWRLTESRFRDLKADLAAADETNESPVDLDNYGKMILADPIDLADLREQMRDLRESAVKALSADQVRTMFAAKDGARR